MRLASRFSHALPLALAGLTPLVATAQTPAPRPGPSVALVLEGGVEYGGDRVLEVLFEDGDTQTMRAGQGGTLAAGVEVTPRATWPLALRATAGIKYVTTAATNADIKMTRIPLELTARVGLGRDLFVAAGPVYHAAVRLDGDGFVPDTDLDSGVGATAELGWRWFALTATRLAYTAPAGTRLDASSVGATATYTFRLR